MSILKKSLSNMFDYIKKAKGPTLRKKYSRWFLYIIIIPVILILILTFVLTTNSKTQQNKLMGTKLFTAADNQVSNTLNSVETQSYLMLTDTQVNLFLFSDNISNDAASSNYTQKLLRNFLKQNNSVIAGQIYSFHNNYLLGSNAANYIDNFSEKSIPWYQYYKKTGATDFIIPTSTYVQNELCMVRSLIMNNKLCAFMIFYIDTNTLFSFKDTESYMLISNTDNRILYSTDNNSDELFDFYASEKDMETSMFNTFIQAPLSSSNTTLVMKTRNTDKAFIYIFIAGAFFIISLSFVLAALLSRYLSNLFYSHISKTISYLTSETSSTYDSSQEEFEWIKNNIDNLLNSNKELEIELSKSIIQLKSAHLKAMQMQSNPHFLFNAMNLANMKIISDFGSDNDASKIIALVSDLLYSSLNTKQYFVSISDELNFAEKYIEIESIKYNHNFDVKFDIDKSILEYKTVRLTLQPLIENAFRHGIHKLPKSNKGILSIIAKEENGSIVFRICDNGDTDADRLAVINDELNNDIYTIVEKHIGLKNVNSRIKILFGPQYGCKIYRSGNITVSEIVIPKQNY